MRLLPRWFQRSEVRWTSSIVALCALALAAGSWQFGEWRLREQDHRLTQSVAVVASISRQFDAILARTDDYLTAAAATQLVLSAEDMATLGTELAELRNSGDHVRSPVALLSTRGSLIATSGLDGLSVEDGPVYASAAAGFSSVLSELGRTMVSAPTVTHPSNPLTLIPFAKARPATESRAGIVAVTMEDARIFHSVLLQEAAPLRGVIALVDDKNRVIAQVPEKSRKLHQMLQGDLATLDKSTHTIDSVSGKAAIANSLDLAGWKVVWSVDIGEVMEDYAGLGWSLFLFGLAVMGCTSWTTWHLASRFARLHNAVRSLSAKVEKDHLFDRETALPFSDDPVSETAVVGRLASALIELDGDRRAALEHYRTLVEKAPEAVIVIAPDTLTIEFANERAAELLMRKQAELIGLKIAAVSAPLQANGLGVLDHARQLLARIQTGTIAVDEWLVQAGDGTQIPLEIRLRLAFGADSRQIALVNFSDLRERKLLEEQNRQLRHWHSLIFEQMPSACVLTSPSLSVVAWNRAAERIFGWTREQVIGQQIDQLLVPDRHRGKVAGIREKVVAPGAQTIAFQSEALTRDAGILVCEWNCVSLVAPDGGFGGMIAMAMDVTQARQAARMRKEHADRFKELAEMSLDWYWETDADNRFTLLEGKLPNIGLNLQSFIGRQFKDFGQFRLAAPKNAPPDFDAAPLTARKPFRGLVIEMDAGGGTETFEVAGNPRFSSNNAFNGFRGMVRNISARVRLEESLRHSERRLHALVSLSTDYFWEQDSEFRFTKVEGSPHSTSLPDLQTALGQRRWELPRTQTKRGWAGHIAQLNRHETFMNLIVETEHGGKVLHFSVSGEPMFSANGEFTGYRGVSHDVTDRVVAEQELSRSQEQFRKLTEMSTDWYWEQDQDFRFTTLVGQTVNARPSMNAAVGMMRWELPGQSILGMSWQQHREQLAKKLPFNDLLLSREDPDGARHVHSVNGEPMYNESGEFLGYHGTGSDISARYRSALLLQGERNVLTQFATGADLDSVLNALCNVIEASAERRLYAAVYCVHEHSMIEIVAPSLPDAYRLKARRIPISLEHGGSCGAAAMLKKISITEDIATDLRWTDYREAAIENGLHSCWSTPILASGERLLGTFALYSEHTGTPIQENINLGVTAAQLCALMLEQSTVRQELKESESRYRILVETSPDAIFIHRDGEVMYANTATARLLGAPSATWLIGRNAYDWLDENEVAIAKSRSQSVMNTGLHVEASEFHVRRFSGERLIVEVSGAPVDIGGLPMIQTKLCDITARKETERRLDELNRSLEARVADRTQALQAANQELQIFSYSVAHDLRSPLRAIDGYARMSLDSLITPSPQFALIREDLEAILAATRRMASLVDGLLEFSRLGQLPLRMSHLSMSAMVASAVSEALISAPSPPLAPSIRVHGSLPDAFGDAVMLQRVWGNLIANAIKYAMPGTPATISISGEVSGNAACYRIQDRGIGFNAEYSTKLFELFERLHGNEISGNGLGLAIVRRIIERHDGTVNASGIEGEGAIFTFTLPLRPETEALSVKIGNY